jgi:hypothetical protein
MITRAGAGAGACTITGAGAGVGALTITGAGAGATTTGVVATLVPAGTVRSSVYAPLRLQSSKSSLQAGSEKLLQAERVAAVPATSNNPRNFFIVNPYIMLI